jgi:hypothetical protein
VSRDRERINAVFGVKDLPDRNPGAGGYRHRQQGHDGEKQRPDHVARLAGRSAGRFGRGGGSSVDRLDH